MTQTKVHPWPTMRADARNTGAVRRSSSHNTNKTIRRLSTQGAIFSTPVVTKDETIVCGSADGMLYAYNPLLDKTEWAIQTEAAIDCAAALSLQERVYAPSCDGKLYTLSKSGEVLNTFDVIHTRTHPTPSSIFWWEGNTAIDEEGNIYAGNDDFYMYSLDAEGNVRWVYATALNIWTAPAIYGDLLVFCSFDFHAYALKKDTGELVWKTRIDNFCVSSPAISDKGVVYFGTFGGTVYALEVATGRVLHTQKLSEHIYASAVIDDNNERIYIGDASGAMYGLALRDLSMQWRIELQGAIRASAALHIDSESEVRTLYCADGAGFMYALTESGEEQWRYNLVEDEESIPDICASIALGNHGVTTATVSGDIIWIPYTWKPDTKEGVEQKDKADLPSEEEYMRQDWAGDYSCTAHNLIFKDPPIISSFDLVAIASVQYQLQFSVDSNGVITGLGSVVFGSEEGADGVTIQRALSYALEGEIAVDGSFSIRSHNCMFELSAFPLPIDTLTFSGTIRGNRIINRTVMLKKKKGSIFHNIKEFLQPQNIRFMWGYLRQVATSGVLVKRPGLLARTIIASIQVLNPHVQQAWNLRNAQGDIIAHGTYASSDIY